jgi:hypothetical protein
MIEAGNLTERLKSYQRAYEAAKTADAPFHEAWREYHRYYTRRTDGAPLVAQGVSDPISSIVGDPSRTPAASLAVNHVQSIVRTIHTTTLNRDPEFYLEPLYAGFEAPVRAHLAACALNNQWRKEKFNGPTGEAYLDSLLYGRGWAKLGWQATYTREVTMPADGKAGRSTLADALKAAVEASRRGARLGAPGIMSPEEIQSHLSRFGGKLLLEDKPTLRRVSPFDMFFDPLAVNVDDARWIAQRWRCPMAAAKKNPDWAAKARKGLSLAGIEAVSEDPASVAVTAGTDEYEGKDGVWIVDFYDLGEGTWCQFAETGAESFLRAPDDIPFPFGHPFVWIENIEDTSSRFPISEVEVTWIHQRELTEIATELSRDRIMSRTKLVVDKEREEEIRAALQSADDGVVVAMNLEGGKDIRTVVQPIPSQPRGDMLMAQAGLMANWMTQASGVSDYLRGGGITGQTATAVNAMQIASANYMGEKASRVRSFIEQIAQRELMMMQVFSKLEHFVATKMENPANDGRIEDVTLAIQRHHLQGSYRVIVTGDSTEMKSPEARRANAQALASTMVPFVSLGTVDPGQLVRYLVREGFGIEDASLLLTQQAYAPQAPPPDGAPPQEIPGVSMTPGTDAGQMGATAALERTATGDSVPTNQ